MINQCAWSNVKNELRQTIDGLCQTKRNIVQRTNSFKHWKLFLSRNEVKKFFLTLVADANNAYEDSLKL